MESLQQATDGDGQRTNTQRYQESNITPRTYAEDKQVQDTVTRRPAGGSLFAIKGRSFTALCAA